MSEAQFSLLTVSLLFIASNVYWAWHSQTLVNKLMSRNFYEYKEASVTTEKPKTKIKSEFAIDDMGSMSEFTN